MPVKTKISMAIVFLVSSVLAPGQSPVTSPKTPNKDAISIQTVLNQVRDALIRCQKKLKGKQYPPLQSVDLTFQTVAEKDAGGTVKLWIISAGAKRESEQTQEVTIHLTPPSADNPTKVGAASLTEELENTKRPFWLFVPPGVPETLIWSKSFSPARSK